MIIVSGFNGVLVGQEDAGDEAYLMASILKGVPVIVSVDRVGPRGAPLRSSLPTR